MYLKDSEIVTIEFISQKSILLPLKVMKNSYLVSIFLNYAVSFFRIVA